MSKEQDALIELLRHEQSSRGTVGAFSHITSLIASHTASFPFRSELKRECPHVGRIFHALDLTAALAEFDERSRVISRTRVPPSFSECRQIFNIATVRASARANLQLISFDADDTLYSDGGVLSFDSPIIPHIIRLLRRGVAVCVVTAAAYPGEPAKYEGRFAGLLAAMAFAIEAGAPKEPLLSRFLLMGGQCNYLLRPACSHEGHTVRVSLEQIEDEEWKAFRGVRWDHAEVASMLDVAEGALRHTLGALRLGAHSLLVRKERAVGVVAKPGGAHLSYEVLEELALATQAALAAHGGAVPACAFNGGRDVFVDVGTKALGIRALQGLLGAQPEGSLHVGDRFTRTGNDVSARDVASTLWVASPEETVALMELLVPLVGGGAGAAEGGGGAAASPTFRVSPAPHITLPPPPLPTALGVAGSAHGSSASLPRSPRGRGPGVGSEASFHSAEEDVRLAAEAKASELQLAGVVLEPAVEPPR